ncbi:MAG: hypothetical protein U1F37_00780 [Alphaproteobacteria bacterium]
MSCGSRQLLPGVQNAASRRPSSMVAGAVVEPGPQRAADRRDVAEPEDERQPGVLEATFCGIHHHANSPARDQDAYRRHRAEPEAVEDGHADGDAAQHDDRGGHRVPQQHAEVELEQTLRAFAGPILEVVLNFLNTTKKSSSAEGASAAHSGAASQMRRTIPPSVTEPRKPIRMCPPWSAIHLYFLAEQVRPELAGDAAQRGSDFRDA